jgi:hypothetical protein
MKLCSLFVTFLKHQVQLLQQLCTLYRDVWATEAGKALANNADASA